MIGRKQSHRKRISGGGPSGYNPVSDCFNSEPSYYDTLSNDDTLSLILSKLSVNKCRVAVFRS